MSIFKSMQENASNLRHRINTILQIDREELYGADRLHQISFKKHGKTQFEMIFNLIEDLSKCHFDRIPEPYISNILNQLNNYKEIFARAQSLSIEQTGDTKSNRDSIVQEVEANYENLYNAVYPVISFANQSGTDFKKIETEVRQTLDSVNSYAENQKKQMKKNTKEVNIILDDIRKASAEAGVSQEAIHYSEAQKHHNKVAGKWYKWGKRLLVSLIILIVITGVVLWCLKKDQPVTLGYLEITTLVVLSLWVYAINFCNKNFHAEKHNETVNANKAKTLATFQSFVDATQNRYIKDQVLVHASASAFANPSTGFGKNQSAPLPFPVEIGKQIANRSAE